ncbi:hypothetical protein HNY73_020512 [Argiope bruennichi]|uniref:Uncharacterized protein n=1 Tax=Argiope bruennichi TaxID=94029 RepID=A0A8T0E8C5_ARGBR|nr:hypothetical protein HNY73_020512 [Argiope bruennichi]
MHLEDCIPAFEIRHIDGPKLLELTEQKLFTYQDLKIKHRKSLELIELNFPNRYLDLQKDKLLHIFCVAQEYLDVDWTNVKYYLRRQIAKCVQECKSQASNAKRIAKTLKHSQSSHSHTSESNGTCDSWDDSDDWGSDFEDEESDDEVKIEHSPSEVNNNSIIQSLPGVLEKPSNTSPVLTSNSSEEKSIPKPPDVPVISKVVNGVSNYKSNNTNSIPRPPLKRPPSQPPPPPVTQASSHIEPQEDYEIPIVPTSTNSKECFSFSGSFQNSLSGESAVIETYEIF